MIQRSVPLVTPPVYRALFAKLPDNLSMSRLTVDQISLKQSAAMLSHEAAIVIKKLSEAAMASWGHR